MPPVVRFWSPKGPWRAPKGVPRGVLGDPEGVLEPSFGALEPASGPPGASLGSTWRLLKVNSAHVDVQRLIFQYFFVIFIVSNQQITKKRMVPCLPPSFFPTSLSPLSLQSSSYRSIQSSNMGLAECAERSAAPRVGVLDSRSEGTCQFFFVSSSSCLHLQVFMPSTYCFNHSLQFFALILAVLEGFFSPS